MNVLMDNRCPKCGAASSDAEFCSECGAPMQPAQKSAPLPIEPAAAIICPDCGQPRPGPLARYCDNCRYDFVAEKPFSPARPPESAPLEPAAIERAPPESAPTEPAPIVSIDPLPVAPSTGAATRWDLIVTVDVSLRKPDDPEPTDLRERIFPLDLGDCLIGRRSDKDDIHPEIPVGDPGISRRHARLLRQPDGSLAVLDLGSMNGTRINAVPVEPNVPTPLAAADQVTLGCWTRLTLRMR